MESVFMVRKGRKIESVLDFSGSYVMEAKPNGNQVWFIIPGKNMSKGGSISFYARKVNKEGENYGFSHNSKGGFTHIVHKVERTDMGYNRITESCLIPGKLEG